MKMLILLLLLLSFFLLGCLGQKNSNDMKEVEQISNQSIDQILANNSSVDEIRTAVTLPPILLGT